MFDSTVFIDALRGIEKAKSYLFSSSTLRTSRIVIMELVAGSDSLISLKKNLKFIADLGLEVYEISEKDSILAGKLFESYYLKYGLGITDALIAAMAVNKNEGLVTHNIKHFKFITGLEVVKPY